MPVKSHERVLTLAINKYRKQGYELVSRDKPLPEMPSYRPDAVLENEEEVVILEVVLNSDRTEKFNQLQGLFEKPIRLDKRVIKGKYTMIQISRDTHKNLKRIGGSTFNDSILKLIRFWHKYKHLEQG